MAIRLDKLLDAWRSDQRPRATVEFCGVLVRASNKPANAHLVTPKFLKEFGEEALERHPEDVDVMLGVAGLYVTAGLLDVAETLLAQAASKVPNDPRLKKLMGKVRLHQGIKGGGPMGGMSDMPRGISFIGTGAPSPGAGVVMPNMAAPPMPRSLSPAFGVAMPPVAPMPRAMDPAAATPQPPPVGAAAPAPPVGAAEPVKRSHVRGAGPEQLDAAPLPVRPSQGAREVVAESPKAFGMIHVLPESSRSPAAPPVVAPAPPMVDEVSSDVATVMREVPVQAKPRGVSGQMPAPLEAAAGAGAQAGTEIHSYDDAYLEKLKIAGEQAERAESEAQADRQVTQAQDEVQDEPTATQVTAAIEGGAIEGGRDDGGLAPSDDDTGDEEQATQVRDLAPMSTPLGPRPAAGKATGGTVRMVHENPPKAFPTTPPGPQQPVMPGPPAETLEDEDPRTAIQTARLAAVHLQVPMQASQPAPPEAKDPNRATSPFDIYPGGARSLGDGADREDMPTAALSPEMLQGPEMLQAAYAASRTAATAGPPSSSPGGAPPLPVVPNPVAPPSVAARRSPVKVFIAVTALTSALGIGLVAYLQLGGTSSSTDTPGASTKSGVPEFDAAILRGGRTDLDAAKAALDAKGDSGTAPVVLAGARERVLRVLDHDPSAPGLEDALSQARTLGLPKEATAFAELVMSAQRDGNDAARALVEELDTLPAVREDAFYQLASGAVLERVGDGAALGRYQIALGKEPGLKAAEFRLVRAMLLYGDVAEGRRRAEALGDRPEATALRALASLVRRGDKAPDKPVALADGPPLPRTLAVIVPLSAAVATESRSERRALLKQVIEGAEIPSLIVLAGSTALAGKDSITAQNAATAALDMATAFPAALRLTGRIVMLTGQLDRLEEVAKGARGPTAKALEGVVAYERGDFTRLLKLHQLQSGVEGVDGLAVSARYLRMLGSEPLSPETLSLLRQPAAVGGQLVVADAALDAGDLKAARVAMQTFSEPASHPLVARRWGRLLRYELDMEAAAIALESAAPTRLARIEQVLVEAETEAGRRHALAVLDETLDPERPFLEAYLRARNRDEGVALDTIAETPIPGGEAPLSLRMAAGLALGEIGDMSRGERLVRALLTTYPANPDVRRAAVGLGLLPRSAMQRD